MKYNTIKIFAAATLGLATACTTQQEQPVEEQHKIEYGIIADDYMLERDEVKFGQTISDILSNYGISAKTVDQLDRASATYSRCGRSAPGTTIRHFCSKIP